MPENKIYAIGYEEIILLLNLLGIKGEVLEKEDRFMTVFKKIANNPSISMIIISFDFSEEILDFIVEFKLNNRKPFVFLMPDLFKESIETGRFLSKITEFTGKLLS